MCRTIHSSQPHNPHDQARLKGLPPPPPPSSSLTETGAKGLNFTTCVHNFRGPATHESCCASLTATRHASTNIFSRTFNPQVMQNPRPVHDDTPSERMDSQVRGRRIRPAADAAFYLFLQKQKRKHKDEGDCKDRRRVPVGGGGTSWCVCVGKHTVTHAAGEGDGPLLLARTHCTKQ